MVHQELADQGFSFFQNQLDGLCSLNQSHLPGYNSQDACFVSAGDQPWRGRFRKETTQARPPLFWEKNTGLAFKLKDASINIRFPREERSVVDEILRREIIRSIDDDIVLLETSREHSVESIALDRSRPSHRD